MAGALYNFEELFCDELFLAELKHNKRRGILLFKILATDKFRSMSEDEVVWHQYINVCYEPSETTKDTCLMRGNTQ